MPHPLRLAMDERMLLDARTGVATYARALRAAHERMADTAMLIGDRAKADGPPPAPFGRAGRWLRALRPAVRALHSTADNPLRWIASDIFRLAQVHFDIWGRPLRLRVPGPAGIAHWTYPLPLRIEGWHNLYTVHDAIPLIAPQLTPIDPRRHRRLLEALAREATAFVTVSESARAEIVEALGAKAPPLANCGQAINSQRPPPGALPAGLARRGYLLVVGSVETRKNIATIIEGYRAAGIAMPLVVAGPDGWGAEALAPLFAEPAIVRLPFLPTGDLRRLIANAEGLLMLSRAEGFGLPIAEAMALGTPVITANRGAQAETAGGAALLADPDDAGSIAAAIGQLTLDEAVRSSLIERGHRRAESFSVANFTDRLRTLYSGIA